MSKNKRLAISLLAAAGITALAATPIPNAEFLLEPGLLLASLFWPEGIHSGGMGMASVVAMLLIVWCGTFFAWGAIAYAATALFGKVRAV